MSGPCAPPRFGAGDCLRAERTRLAYVSSGNSAVRCKEFLKDAATAWRSRRDRLGFRWLAETTAITDHAPDQRIPGAPGFLGIAPHVATHDLWRLAERLRHHLRQFRIGEDVPFGIAAHQARADPVNHAADARLADRERAHRAGLDIRVERAARQILRPERFLRHADRDDLGMPRHVAVARDPVEGFDNDFPVLRDHARERKLAYLLGGFGKLDAARHHGRIDCFGRRPIHHAHTLLWG